MPSLKTELIHQMLVCSLIIMIKIINNLSYHKSTWASTTSAIAYITRFKSRIIASNTGRFFTFATRSICCAITKIAFIHIAIFVAIISHQCLSFVSIIYFLTYRNILKAVCISIVRMDKRIVLWQMDNSREEN